MSDASTKKKTVSITDKQLSFIQEQLESGQYASASEVIRAGLTVLEKSNSAFDAYIEAQMAQHMDRVRRGDMTYVTSEDVSARLEATYNRLKAEELGEAA